MRSSTTPLALVVTLAALCLSTACPARRGPPFLPEAGPSAFVSVIDEGFDDAGVQDAGDVGQDDAGQHDAGGTDAGALVPDGGPFFPPFDGGTP